MLRKAIQDLYDVCSLDVHAAVLEDVAELPHFVIAGLLASFEVVHAQKSKLYSWLNLLKYCKKWPTNENVALL